VRAHAWVRQRDLVLISAWFLASVFTWIFFEIAEGISDEPSFDARILLALRRPEALHEPVGPAWLQTIWLDLTALGSGVVIGLVALIVLGYLAMLKEWKTALVFLVALAGATLGGTVLKEVFDRARPTLIVPLYHSDSLSFPSGHSLLAAVVYPTLGAMLSRVVRRRSLKLYFIVVAFLLMLLVGFSRVYIGVHYPSDVLAGWSLGLGWAIVCWTVLRMLQRKRIVEPAPPGSDMAPAAG
jgi:undecaprenyl-diphosphatase